VFTLVQQFVAPQKEYIVNQFVLQKYVFHHADHHVDLHADLHVVVQKEYVHQYVAQKEYVVLLL
jgi:hypothetical protein